MEKITTVVDQKTARELFFNTQLLNIVAFVFGLICIGMYFLFSFLNNNYGEMINIVLLVLGTFLIALSLFLEFALQRRINIYKKNGYEATYEFFNNHIQLQAFRNGEKFQDGKIKYTDIYGYWESKNYINLKLNNLNTLPINKISGLTEFLDSKGVLRRKK
ncbi:MAG: hypothetical protein J5880_00095 [Bacilli bacterium]|nr:hypothetical protein [Bacilli bacterium]